MESCAYCGEDVPAGRSSCPHCGSDAETGWASQEEQDAAAVDLSFTSLDDAAYEEFLENEGLAGRSPSPARRSRLWRWVALLAALALLLLWLRAAHASGT